MLKAKFDPSITRFRDPKPYNAPKQQVLNFRQCLSFQYIFLPKQSTDAYTTLYTQSR